MLKSLNSSKGHGNDKTKACFHYVSKLIDLQVDARPVLSDILAFNLLYFLE